jgi:hypothetical protein
MRTADFGLIIAGSFVITERFVAFAIKDFPRSIVGGFPSSDSVLEILSKENFI